jgi:hypothetical protein
MNVGSEHGFTFTAFIKIDSGDAPIIEWAAATTGVSGYIKIWVKTNKLFLGIIPNGETALVSTSFAMPLSADTWSFIGVSYDIKTKEAVGFVDTADPSFEVKALSTTINSTAAKEILMGKGNTDPVHLKGDISCAMVFDRALHTAYMKWARVFCVKGGNRPNTFGGKEVHG